MTHQDGHQFVGYDPTLNAAGHNHLSSQTTTNGTVSFWARMYLSDSIRQPMSNRGAYLRALVKHEAGHSFGLVNASHVCPTRSSSVMFEPVGIETDITPCDTSTISNAYSPTPTPTPPPPGGDGGQYVGGGYDSYYQCTHWYCVEYECYPPLIMKNESPFLRHLRLPIAMILPMSVRETSRVAGAACEAAVPTDEGWVCYETSSTYAGCW